MDFATFVRTYISGSGHKKIKEKLLNWGHIQSDEVKQAAVKQALKIRKENAESRNRTNGK